MNPLMLIDLCAPDSTDPKSAHRLPAAERLGPMSPVESPHPGEQSKRDTLDALTSLLFSGFSWQL
jgi:hypothetical protein